MAFNHKRHSRVGILIIFLLLGFLVWGKWRYDGVTLTALAVMVLLGLVSPKEAFLGFSNAAVITVALVLLISKALEKSGFINMIGDLLRQKVSGEMQFLFILMIVAAFLSSFMNNIGAMAMLLPITIGIAQKMEWNPSKFLMPLAFASILGGMNTKIGTPPNILISEKREDATGLPFEFFDFWWIPPNEATWICRWILGLNNESWILFEKICQKLNLPATKRVNDLTEEEVLKIREFIDANHKVEGDLRREIAMNIKRLASLHTTYTTLVKNKMHVLLKSPLYQWFHYS